MESSKIKAILIVIVSVFLALYLGISAATAQLETILWVLGGVGFTICLLLGKRIWLLIPFLGSLGLTLRLPGLPSTLLLAQVLLIGFSVLLLLTRKLPFQLRFTELEFWSLVLIGFVLQAYMRNPVGISLFGATTVGGKAYLLFGIAVLAAAILAGLRVPPDDLRAALRLSIIGGLLNITIAVAGRFIPTIGYWTGANFSAGGTDYRNFGEDPNAGYANRESSLVVLSQNLSLWISSFRSPLKAIFHPIWGPLVVLSLAGAALSGFRNTVALVGLTYLVGLIYRGGGIQLIISGLFGVLCLAMVAMINVAAPLPANLQRSLSFLPGSWDERHVHDARTSSEWRYEIWREVLLTDRWIANKWFGDGLGFSARELQYQMSQTENTGIGASGFDSQREAILANGDYHSGPVSTIRIIGYIGLICFMLAQIRLAVHAHRQIRRSRGTEWFPLALFFGIPLISAPVFFMFVFGDFKSASSTFLLSCGMLRLIESNLPLPALATGLKASPRQRFQGAVAVSA